MEGADPHRPRPGTDQRGDPLLHLVRGLVGERDREDLASADLAHGQQIGDPVREHPCLARSRARDHEQRRTGMDDRGPLLRVQPPQQDIGIESRSGTTSLLARVGTGVSAGIIEVGVRTAGKSTHSKSIICSTSDSSGSDAHSTPYEAPVGLTTGRSAGSASRPLRSAGHPGIDQLAERATAGTVRISGIRFDDHRHERAS